MGTKGGAGALLFVIITMSGCSQHFTSATKSFADGIAAVDTTVAGDLAALTRVERVLGARRLLDGEPVDFSEFACAGVGVDRWSRQQGALVASGQYAKTLAEIAAAPDPEFGALFASIKRWATERPDVALPEIRATVRTDCEESVRKALALDSRLPEVTVRAPLAGLALVQSLAKAVEGFSKKLLQITDEAVRTSALTEFIKVSENCDDPHACDDKAKAQKGVIAQVLGRMTIADDWIVKRRQIVDPGTGTRRDGPIVVEDAYLDADSLALLLAYRKRGALEIAAHEFGALQAAARSARSPAERAKVMEASLTVHQALGDFDVLRRRAPIRAVLDKIQEARFDLLRLANGRLDASEALGSLWAFARLMAEVAEGGKQAAGDVRTAIEKSSGDKP